MEKEELNDPYSHYLSFNQSQLNTALKTVVRDNDLETVKFLLTSPSLKIHADINSHSGAALTLACSEGHLEIAKYLLTSSELTEYANVYTDVTKAFRHACASDQFEIIKYLIFEYDIEKNEDISSYLSYQTSANESRTKKMDIIPDALKMFETRALNKNLKDELIPSSSISKKIKI